MLPEGSSCSQATNYLQLKNDRVSIDLYSNWATARNYEEILDIYMKHFPDTSIEELTKTAHLGFNSFRMADSIDKGLQMLGRVAK